MQFGQFRADSIMRPVEGSGPGGPLRLKTAWRRLRNAVILTVATRSLRVTFEAARRHHLGRASNFLRAGGRLNLERAQYREADLPLRPEDWGCLTAFGELCERGTAIRKTDEGFDISLASGRMFELPSRSLLPSALEFLKWHFVDDEYEALDVAGAIVIDVGANIGDTAVYFADKGAAHVYAFEPFPELYATAVGVVRRNRLENIVTVTPRGVGARNGRTSGVYTASWSGWSHASPHSPTHPRLPRPASNRSVEVDLVSLPSVLSQATKDHPGLPLVLKVNCEGCEFEAFAGEGIHESLKPVKSVLLEIHGADCRQNDSLCKKLEDYGFSVKNVSSYPWRVPPLVLATRKVVGEGTVGRDQA